MARRTEPASELPALTPGLRRYLFITAATTGAAILIVEILGAKMLSPFFGASHFVWTAQIGVTLLALATGYYVGGWWVDQKPRLSNLFAAILAAAVYLGGTVPLVRGVAMACLGLNLALGSLLAALFLFFVPLAALAMTGPFLVRILTIAVEQVGGNVGRLTAVSTLGSVAGTALIGYVLIPHLPNSVTMLLTAGALFVLVTIYHAVWGRAGRPAAGLTVALAALACFAWSGLRGEWSTTIRYGNAPWTVRYRANSNFGQVLVIDRSEASHTLRLYLNDGLVQNTYDPTTGQSTSLFTELLHGLARAYRSELKSALCIGMGTGIVPMKLASEGVAVDVVEINPAVAPLAEQWFGFEPNRMRRIYFQDARWFLNRPAELYDAILLDAFLGDSSPSHLLTREAFTAMRERLRPGGVLVINSFGRGLEEVGIVSQEALVFDQADDFFSASLHDTLAEVFPDVRVHGSGNGNVFMVASTQPLIAVQEPDFSQIHWTLQHSYDLRHQPLHAWARQWTVKPGIGQVLTDDYNPVEYRDAHKREATRRGLAAAFQNRDVP